MQNRQRRQPNLNQGNRLSTSGHERDIYRASSLPAFPSVDPSTTLEGLTSQLLFHLILSSNLCDIIFMSRISASSSQNNIRMEFSLIQFHNIKRLNVLYLGFLKE